jgi:hypothetical protein
MGGGIDNVIAAFVHRNNSREEEAHDDEYERWRTQEPEWSKTQYTEDGAY